MNGCQHNITCGPRRRRVYNVSIEFPIYVCNIFVNSWKGSLQFLHRQTKIKNLGLYTLRGKYNGVDEVATCCRWANCKCFSFSCDGHWSSMHIKGAAKQSKRVKTIIIPRIISFVCIPALQIFSSKFLIILIILN